MISNYNFEKKIKKYELYYILEIIFPADINNYSYKIYGDKNFIHNRMGQEIFKSLQYGVEFSGKSTKPFTREIAFQRAAQLLQNRNRAEEYRAGIVPLRNEDYLEYANRSR